MTGTDYERKLWIKLWNEGYGCMRSPASGGGRKHPQPDLLVSDREKDFLYAIEVKRTKGKSLYVGKDEVEDLKDFCERWGEVEAVIAARFDKPVGWIFKLPEECETTEKSIKITRKDSSDVSF